MVQKALRTRLHEGGEEAPGRPHARVPGDLAAAPAGVCLPFARSLTGRIGPG